MWLRLIIEEREINDAWWEEGKKRLDKCIKKQKARDDRIIEGWDKFKSINPELGKGRIWQNQKKQIHGFSQAISINRKGGFMKCSIEYQVGGRGFDKFFDGEMRGLLLRYGWEFEGSGFNFETGNRDISFSRLDITEKDIIPKQILRSPKLTRTALGAEPTQQTIR